MVELKHTLTLRRDAWFVRFYVWLWEASPSDINFCKLFWGLTLAPLGLFLRATLVPVFRWLNRRLDAREEKRKAEQRERLNLLAEQLQQDGINMEGWPELDEEPEPEPPSQMQQILNGISDRVTKMRMSSWWRWFRVGLLWFGILLGIAATVLVGYLCVTVAWPWLEDNWLEILIRVGLFVAATCGIVAVLALIGWKGTELRGALGTGYRAVKSNTCPRVELTEKKR